MSISEDTQLVGALQQAYGFQIAYIEFLQRGWGGDCYRVDTQSGERYFLKLHDPGPQGAFAASSRQFYLPLMDQLYQRGILSHIPHPIRTRAGNLSLAIGTRELVVTPFIQGEVLGYGQLPSVVLVQLADLVGILHASLTKLTFEHPFVEQFEVAFDSVLISQLAALDVVTSQHSTGCSN